MGGSSVTRQYKIETLAVHGGQVPDPTTGSRAVPIYQTTAYVFHDTDHAQQLFALDEPGNIYSRIGNPTNDVFEKRIALMEGGVGAVSFSSGHAALVATILTICHAGDEIVTANSLYGGTYNLFGTTLPKYGITAKFVDPADPESFRRAITPRTRVIFGEVIGNPRLDVFDIEAVAKIAHENGIPLIIDNTFASPVLCRPIEWGADLVIHSATKWLGGHGAAMGGVVVDGGRFDWNSPKFPGFTEPDPSYHGVRYAMDFGSLAFMTKVRVQMMRDLGACQSPFNSFLLLLGLESLPLRMRAHSENATAVAQFLKHHPAVEWVQYPGLPDHPTYARAEKYLQGGFGGMLVFGVKGGLEAGAKFIDNVSLFSHLANVGDSKSLVIHPASTTHQQLTPEQRVAAGVGDDLIRVSVGVENVQDLIADLDHALRVATGLGTEDEKLGEGEIIVNDEGVIRWVLNSAYVTENGERRAKILAVVGLSDNQARPSYRVSRKMQRLGYKIVPVSPKGDYILGEKVYRSLQEIPFPVDVVQVFRAPQYALDVLADVREMQHRPRIFWMQEGVINDEAAAASVAYRLQTVHNRCTYKEAQRLKGTMATFKGQ
jgi:O-acetylhomoserine (thiol)-lyase